MDCIFYLGHKNTTILFILLKNIFGKGFKKLQNTKFEKGKNTIICTADKISVIDDGTFILPVSSI